MTACGSNSSAMPFWWILPVTTSKAMFASDQPTWQNPRILTTLVLVFLTGAMAGAIGMRAGLHEQLHRSVVRYWRGDRAEFSYEQLQKELNLTPEQSDRLKTILDDFVKYHEDLEAQIEDVRATGRNRIVQILTPEQRKRFEQLSNQLPAQ
jgi:Spy/CpxP family protein refolding chaperone